MTKEEQILTEGNILLSKYLYGEPIVTNYYQIGYNKIGSIIYRNSDKLYDDLYSNFHNNWEYLMDVISKIAKDPIEDFTDEDRLVQELKNNMFQFSYDIKESWKIVVQIVKLKMTV